MVWLPVLLSLAYGIPIALFALGFHRTKRRKAIRRAVYSVSVVIAARNEENHIEACLNAVIAQDFLCQIIVVDDGSEDATAEIVLGFGKRVELISLDAGQGKKAAIEAGVSHASGELILLTDADTIVPQSWIREMTACFDESTAFVAGGVMFKKPARFFDRIVALEWLGFMGITAGAIGLGKPILCSGANIAYRRSVFFEVGAYSGLDHLSSGDDELLMQRIADTTSWKVVFCAVRGAIVETQAPGSPTEFFAQRRRWASKGVHYDRAWLIAMNIGFWLFFLSLPIAGAVSIWNEAARFPLLMATLVKIIPEFALLYQSAKFYGRISLLKEFVLAQPFQIAYILWAGAAGVRGNLEWKSRKLRR